VKPCAGLPPISADSHRPYTSAIWSFCRALCAAPRIAGSPTNCEANKGDYLGIDEGNNGSLNNFYAIYAKSLTQPGEIKLRTEIDGNIDCLVIKTNGAGRTSTTTHTNATRKRPGGS
jgi:hypothetical protein